MEGFKTYVAQRSKAFAAGIGAAVTTAIIKHAEVSFGFDIPEELEAWIISGVAGLGAGIATYWAPANKPMEPKP
jgi:hypothetical protein